MSNQANAVINLSSFFDKFLGNTDPEMSSSSRQRKRALQAGFAHSFPFSKIQSFYLYQRLVNIIINQLLRSGLKTCLENEFEGVDCAKFLNSCIYVAKNRE